MEMEERERRDRRIDGKALKTAFQMGPHSHLKPANLGKCLNLIFITETIKFFKNEKYKFKKKKK